LDSLDKNGFPNIEPPVWRDELDAALEQERIHAEKVGEDVVPAEIQEEKVAPKIEVVEEEFVDDYDAPPLAIAKELEGPPTIEERLKNGAELRLVVPDAWKGELPPVERTEEATYHPPDEKGNWRERPKKKSAVEKTLIVSPVNPVSASVYKLTDQLLSDTTIDDDERQKRLLAGTKLLRLARQIDISLTGDDTDALRAFQRLDDMQSGGKLPQRADEGGLSDELSGIIMDL
jgi:hypothetical protein